MTTSMLAPKIKAQATEEPGTFPAVFSLLPSLIKCEQENPRSIEKVKGVLEKHPWCANQQARLQHITSTFGTTEPFRKVA
jgi:hypothetical protein